MLPVILHPDEWLDGALVPSLNSWFGGTETYFYQNHPVILDLYRRHQAREINFVGTVATVAGNDNVDRERQCHAAANLVKWTLRADGAVMTKYGGGLPHADLSETARLLEQSGIKTAVMVSDVSRDRRVESALLFNVPEVNAIVYNGGNGTQYEIPKAARVIAAKPELAELLVGPMTHRRQQHHRRHQPTGRVEDEIVSVLKKAIGMRQQAIVRAPKNPFLLLPSAYCLLPRS